MASRAGGSSALRIARTGCLGLQLKGGRFTVDGSIHGGRVTAVTPPSINFSVLHPWALFNFVALSWNAVSPRCHPEWRPRQKVQAARVTSLLFLNIINGLRRHRP